MAVAAEAHKQTPYHEDISNQEFGHSLATITEMGRLSCIGARVELEHVADELWHDFVTGVQENVVISDQDASDPTAQAMRERLQFEPMRTLEIRDGKTVTSDGRSIESLCENGVLAAKAKAEQDERMQSEVERSENDVWVARQVDSLKVGEALAVASLEPLDAMDRDGDAYWATVSVIGYKRGLAVMQIYYRATETEMLAGAYSIKSSSKAAFQQLFAENDVNMPLDTPANHWITNPIRKRIDVASAQQFGPKLRARYQQIIGRQVDSVSVTQLMQDNEPLVRTYFDTYIKSLAVAHYTGKNNDVMRGLATALLSGGSNKLLGGDDLRSLMRVANAVSFTDQDARFMERTVRYACAEELWNILLSGNSAPVQLPVGTDIRASDSAAQLALHNRAASRVRTGLSLGRSGGGCSGLKFDRPESAGSDEDDDRGQQDIFGGNLGNDDEEVSFDGKPKACAYIHDQCYCSPYDDFSNPIGVRKMVVAYRDRKGTATCLRPGCGACIDKDSNVLSYGGIFELAQKKERQQTEPVPAAVPDTVQEPGQIQQAA